MLDNEFLDNMTFESFQEKCKSILTSSDEELQEICKDEKTSPNDIRKKYQEILSSITPEEYNEERIKQYVNSLKEQGNTYFKEGKFKEASENYMKALSMIEELKEDVYIREIKTNLNLNAALAFIKTEEPDKAIDPCIKVSLHIIIGTENRSV